MLGISITNVNQLERIQRYFTSRRFARVFPGFTNVSYMKRLDLLHLEPLECYLYKIDLHNMYRILQTDFSVPSIKISYSNRRPNRLCVSKVRSTFRRSFYVHRTIMLWNRHLSDSDLLSLTHLKSVLSGQTFDSFVKGSVFKALWAVCAVLQKLQLQ